MSRHITRWDLDKTYLRTEFDTVRDLVRTALERADEKRTNPGASTLLRELSRAGVSIHVLSGSPEQMRRRLEDKLRLDGITWDSFTLKPNLENLLKLRFRAVRDQLGYKLPALLTSRIDAGETVRGVRETLVGDDAEADAFVYALYADVMSGRVGEELLHQVCEKGRVYEDVIEDLIKRARLVEPEPVVERVLIHLERQTPPDQFHVYGGLVVPFYNYLQAAFIVHEDGRLPSEAVLRVAVELALQHRFDGDALARSYADLARRGHLRGERLEELDAALASWEAHPPVPAGGELRTMLAGLPDAAKIAKARHRPPEDIVPDYLTLVGQHNRRRRKRR